MILTLATIVLIHAIAFLSFPWGRSGVIAILYLLTIPLVLPITIGMVLDKSTLYHTLSPSQIAFFILVTFSNWYLIFFIHVISVMLRQSDYSIFTVIRAIASTSFPNIFSRYGVTYMILAIILLVIQLDIWR